MSARPPLRSSARHEPFTVERRCIAFLVGGGQGAQTALRLLVDGKVVRTASGRNEERLAWRHWDVSEFAGREARLEGRDGFEGVVDCCDAKGCWLVLTDEATDITKGQRVALVPLPAAPSGATPEARGLPVLPRAGDPQVHLRQAGLEGKEGLATIKELLELAPSLPIIAISAGSTFTDTETLGWAKSYGAKFTLPKPLAAAAVLETLGQIFK